MQAALQKFERLIRPCSAAELESMAAEAALLTRRHFGRTLRLFAPLYLSNECVNSCRYCGFSRKLEIPRTTLAPEEMEAEARHLLAQGFRCILLVAGEHPGRISVDYLVECVRRLRAMGVPSIHLEVGSFETADYRRMAEAGAEGFVLYQETYDRALYAELHPAGPKKDYDWRLSAPERAASAGFRRIGIGALLGLADWRAECLALAGHLDRLMKSCWKSFLTVSLPRLRPAAGAFEPPHPVGDRALTQAILALRIAFPRVGIVLSTREPPALRDGLIPLGVTLLSAASRTDPGGYTGAGKERAIAAEDAAAGEQFAVSDDRPLDVILPRIRELGYDPVWKDWDPGLTG